MCIYMYMYICAYICIYTCIYIYLLSKAEKPPVCLSVYIFLVERISAMAVWVGANLARNESYVFWHQHVYIDKFLTALVCYP